MSVMVCKFGTFNYEHYVYVIENDSVVDSFKITLDDAASKIATYAAKQGVSEIQIEVPIKDPKVMQPLADEIQTYYTAIFGHLPQIDIKFI